MKDREKTKGQLISELIEARRQIARLKTTDIQRNQVEKALIQSEERFRLLVGHCPLGIGMSRHGKTVYANQAYLDMFGYEDLAELQGTSLLNQIAPQCRSEIAERVRKRARGEIIPSAYETIGQRKDGSLFPFLIEVVRILLPDGPATVGFFIDITERRRAAESLWRRNRELALLNRVSQTFTSTLDLDQVLVTVLEEVRRLLSAVGCSIWLIDRETDELICQQVIGPQHEIVRGWRLEPGQGIAGWVVRHGESLIVPDVQADERDYKGVVRRTGLPLRSILSIPLRVKDDVIGVLQVVDTEVNHFSTGDLKLVEPIAASAAIAIENAQLYKQAQRDAEVRAILLREVNHRVKNNLSAIIGLLYAERRRASPENRPTCQILIDELINRVHGLVTAHNLLSASKWGPLQLSNLADHVIHTSLQTLPCDKQMSAETTPSPVQVTPDQAHNLTLVINELATNTIKYTLRERDAGHIAVHIFLEGDTVQFEFRDDGPGYPQEVLSLEHCGVGLDLIQNIVHRNLRGELSLQNDRGAVTTIRFKAET